MKRKKETLAEKGERITAQALEAAGFTKLETPPAEICRRCGFFVDVCCIRTSGLQRKFEAALKRAGLPECAWRNPAKFPTVANVAAKFIVDRKAAGDVILRPS